MNLASPSVETPGRFFNIRDRILIALLAICAFALYFPTRRYDFVGYDDQLYVYENLRVLRGLSWESIRWAISSRTIVAANWHPLTMLMELTIATFWGPNPGAYHMVSALLHVLNVVLLFLLIRSATGRSWAAFFTAALWGFHPLRVESVAWISELKDVLCGALWLSCMLAYLRYSRHRTIGRWVIVFLLNALALLAKPMAVTLPAALLLIDYWPLHNRKSLESRLRWWSFRVLEKLPLLLLCIADTLRALQTQQPYTSEYTAKFSAVIRIENAVVSYVMYIRDALVPTHLVFFYPHPVMMEKVIPISQVIFCAAILLGITTLCLIRSRKQPFLIVGWLWFLGTLVPVIGFVHFGEQSRADRYTYLPSIGITFAVVFLVGNLTAQRRMLPRCAAGLAVLAAIGFSVSTLINVRVWKDTRTLFAHALFVQPDNYLAVAMSSAGLRIDGQFERAIEQGEYAVKLAPKSDGAHIELAMADAAANHLDAAWNEFFRSLQINKTNPDAWIGIAKVCDQQAAICAGLHQIEKEKTRRSNAVTDFTNALKFDPDSVEARELLAVELAKLNRIDDAIAQWQDLLERMPTYSQAHGDLADALLLKGDLQGAVSHYESAVSNGSKNPGWESKLAYLVATDPQRTPAEFQPMKDIAKDACDQTHDQDPDALDAYAACLARVGIFDLAIETAQKAMDRANASQNAVLSRAISKRLERYKQYKPFLIGDEK